ncbi:MAG: hypothetical protein QME66_00775 [Candidatus Eisenbacteria bacterium]|nr:hypothetical protein [Candidatus Eisenbacteria bacterium]
MKNILERLMLAAFRAQLLERTVRWFGNAPVRCLFHLGIAALLLVSTGTAGSNTDTGKEGSARQATGVEKKDGRELPSNPEKKLANNGISPAKKTMNPEIGSVPRTSYQSSRRRDPFYSLLDGEFESEFPVKLPNIGECYLVGVVWGEGEWLAILEDKDDRSYIVREGDPVIDGYTIQVRKKEVIFTQRGYGETRTVSLKLRDREKASGTKNKAG